MTNYSEVKCALLRVLREFRSVGISDSNDPGKNFRKSTKIYLVDVLVHILGQNSLPEMERGIE